jgi:uncharacterized OsmC-like protein
MTRDMFGTILHTSLNREKRRPLEMLSVSFAACTFLVATTLLRFRQNVGSSSAESQSQE